MDIAGEAEVEDEVDLDGGREFRSGAISFIVAGPGRIGLVLRKVIGRRVT
jgi:hypothetical protein